MARCAGEAGVCPRRPAALRADSGRFRAAAGGRRGCGSEVAGEVLTRRTRTTRKTRRTQAVRVPASSAPSAPSQGVARMAKIDVPMPQMGESIAEGTLSKWLKKVGDPVKRDEPIFEISTDKVDAEIPAPAAGVLAEILVQEGQTVAVQTVVARLETDATVSPQPSAVSPQPAAVSPTSPAVQPSSRPAVEPPPAVQPSSRPAVQPPPAVQPSSRPAVEPSSRPPVQAPSSLKEPVRTMSSPPEHTNTADHTPRF